MEENNSNIENTENKEGTEKLAVKRNNYWKANAGMLCAAFLGGFLAMYFVADQIFDNHRQVRYFVPDRLERKMIKDFEKMYENERKAFERNFSDFSDFSNFYDFDNSYENMKKHYKKTKELQDELFNIFTENTMEGVNIKSELDNEKYKVIVDLKPFKGDESKVNYNISGRKLTIFGNTIVKDKDLEQKISFTQDYLLPYNADIANIIKKKDDNKLIIEVPLKSIVKH